MRATSEVWQQKVNARLYRHIAIAITERHVLEVYLPFNSYDDENTNADLNVAFAWQSGHRPLQRGITYGLNGAFPNRLQPALLRAYEWASTRWHEFIRQPSRGIDSLAYISSLKPTASPGTGSLKRTAEYALGSEPISHSRTASTKRIKGLGMRDLPATRSSSSHNEMPYQETPYFTYLPDLQLLGCGVCAIMVTRQRMKHHLRDLPHHLGSAEIKEVQNWASNLVIIGDNKEIDKLPLLPDDTPPITVLGNPTEGVFDACSRLKTASH